MAETLEVLPKSDQQNRLAGLLEPEQPITTEQDDSILSIDLKQENERTENTINFADNLEMPLQTVEDNYDFLVNDPSEPPEIPPELNLDYDFENLITSETSEQLQKAGQALRESQKPQVDIVQRFFGIDPSTGKAFVEKEPEDVEVDITAPPVAVADPSEPPTIPPPPPTTEELLRSLPRADLEAVADLLISNPIALPDDIAEPLYKELRIKEQTDLLRELDSFTQAKLLTIAPISNIFNIQQKLSELGISPLDKREGDQATLLQAAERLRVEFIQADPTLANSIIFQSPNILRGVLEFSLTPDPTRKITALNTMPSAVRAAVSVGSRAGLSELLTLPAQGETFEEKLDKTVIAIEGGVIAGALFSLTGTALRSAWQGFAAQNPRIASIADRFFKQFQKTSTDARAEALKELGLQRGASQADIRTAYRKRAVLLHPDKVADFSSLPKQVQARINRQFNALRQAKDSLLRNRNLRGFRAGFADISPFEEAGKELAKAGKEVVGEGAAGIVPAAAKVLSRRQALKQVTDEIKANEIYQLHIEGAAETAQIPPGTYIIGNKSLPAEVTDFIGEPGTPGYKGYLKKNVISLQDAQKQASAETLSGKVSLESWDQAMLQAGIEGTESEFIQLLDDAVLAKKQGKKQGKGLSDDAVQRSLDSGDPFFELLVQKRGWIEEGLTADEINTNIREWARNYQLEEEDIADQLLGAFKETQVKAKPTTEAVKVSQKIRDAFDKFQEKQDIADASRAGAETISQAGAKQGVATRAKNQMFDIMKEEGLSEVEADDLAKNLVEESFAKPAAKEKVPVETELQKQITGLEKQVLTLMEQIRIAKAAKQLVHIPELERQEAKFQEQIANLKAKSKERVQAFRERVEVRRKKAVEAGKARVHKLRLEFKGRVGKAVAAGRERVKGLKGKQAEQRQQIEDLRSLIVEFVPSESQGKFLTRLTRATTEKRVQDLVTAVEIHIDRTEQRQAIRDLKKTWKAIKKRFKRGNVELGMLNEQTRQRLIETMNKIDLVKITPGKERQLESLAKHIQSLGVDVASGIVDLNSDLEGFARIPQQLVDELSRLGKKPVSDMQTADIKAVEDSLKMLIRQAELKDKIIRNHRIEDIRDVFDNALAEIVPGPAVQKQAAEIAAGKPIEASERKRRNALSALLKEESAHLDTLIELATAKDAGFTKQLVAGDLQAGEVKSIGVFRQGVEFMQQRIEDIDFTWSDRKELDEVHEVTIGGKPVNITTDTILALDRHIRNPENLKRLLTAEGLQIEGVDLPAASMQELIDIVSVLTDKQKAFGEIFAEMNQAIQQPALNETSLIVNGFELARDRTYFPIHRILPKPLKGKKVDLPSIETQGRYLPRTGSTHPIRIAPFSRELMEGLQSDSVYHGMTIPFQNAKTLLASKEWQSAMKEAGHESLTNEILKIVSRAEGATTDRSIVEMIGQKVLNKFAQSVLSLRVSTIGTQIGSLPAAKAEIGIKYVRPFVPIGKDRTDRMTKSNPYFWMRFKGMRINIDVGNIAAGNSFDTFLFGRGPLLQRPLRGLVWGDKQALGNIHIWVENEIADTTSLNPGTPEFEKAVGKRLEEVVRRTQPSWSMLDRSTLGSNPNVFLRSSLMFRTALEAQQNILLRASNRLAKSEKTAGDLAKFANDYGSVAASIATVTVWKKFFKWAVATGSTAALAAMGIFRPDDGKEPLDVATDTGKDFFKNILSLFPFGRVIASATQNVINALGDGHNWNQRKFWGNPFIDLAAVAIDSAAEIALATSNFLTSAEFEAGPRKGELKWKTNLKNALDGIADLSAKLTGAPYSAPKQEFVWPATKRSRHPIVRDMREDDVDDIVGLSKRIENVYRLRNRLKAIFKKQFPEPDTIEEVDFSEERFSLQYRVEYLKSITGVFSQYNAVLQKTDNTEERRALYERVEMAVELAEETENELTSPEQLPEVEELEPPELLPPAGGTDRTQPERKRESRFSGMVEETRRRSGGIEQPRPDEKRKSRFSGMVEETRRGDF